jgi:predicted enzyme related to lactoylglutathione lyase
MTSQGTPVVGTVGWIDLTVADAAPVRDFYADVVGWAPTGLDMGGYEDFVMTAPGGDVVAGVCHARGPNVGLPAVWLPYFVVSDIAASVAACAARGGAVVSGPRDMGEYGVMAVLRDPAGAHCAAIQPPVVAKRKSVEKPRRAAAKKPAAKKPAAAKKAAPAKKAVKKAAKKPAPARAAKPAAKRKGAAKKR